MENKEQVNKLFSDIYQQEAKDDVALEALLKAFGDLSDREEAVLTVKYGLKDGRIKTLEETATYYGVTREKIRQVIEKAFKKLKHPTRTKNILI